MGVPGIRIEQNRIKLSDQIPLRTPYSVTIVPSSYCNFSCTFCPCRLMMWENKSTIMSLDKFKGIINNAGFQDKVKMLHLYNVGEPLMNQNVPGMIAYAKLKGFSERVSFVTNASLMDRSMAREVIKAGADRIIVSLYGLNDADYMRNTHRRRGFEEIYENVKYLNSIKKECKIYVKVIDRVLDSEEKLGKFIGMFKDHCDYYSMEPVLPIWPNFKPEDEENVLQCEYCNRPASHLITRIMQPSPPHYACLNHTQQDGYMIIEKISVADKGLYEGVPAKERVACYYPFYAMVVNAHGKVNPCLADWSEMEKLGNTSEQGLSAIWNGPRYHEFRLMQLLGKRLNHPLCRTCGTLKAATDPRDDIDADRERLLGELYGEDDRNRTVISTANFTKHDDPSRFDY